MRWPYEPTPAVPQLSLPGLALAWATSSGSELTGREGCTASSSVPSVNWVTGTRSLSGSNGVLRRCGRITTLREGVTTKVYPSGGDFTAASRPSAPDAPPRFSITNCWPSVRDSRSANGRMELSAEPPGPKLTMMRTVRFGQSPAPCATTAGPDIASANSAAAPQRTRKYNMTSSLSPIEARHFAARRLGRCTRSLAGDGVVVRSCDRHSVER